MTLSRKGLKKTDYIIITKNEKQEQVTSYSCLAHILKWDKEKNSNDKTHIQHPEDNAYIQHHEDNADTKKFIH